MQLDQFARGIAALFSAGLVWLAEISPLTPLPNMPQWIMELGLPVAFLLAVIYALVCVHKALRASEEGRRADWIRFSEKLEEMVEHGRDSRERLIHATHEQTAEFRRLAEQLKNRPCQLPRDP